MKLLHSMDAESGDLRPNHNLKLVFSPVRHVYHRSACPADNSGISSAGVADSLHDV